MKTTAQKFKRWVIILCIIPLVSSCSLLSIVYNYADLILLRVIDNSLNLNEEQEVVAEAGITRFLKWHKEEELPKYILFTKKMAAAVQGPISLAELTAYEQEIIVLQENAILHFCSEIAPVLMLLTEEQLQEFQLILDENREKILEPLKLPIQERHSKQYQRYKKNTEEWTGPLSYAQQLQLKDLISRFPSWEIERHANHKANSDAFFQLMRQEDKNTEQIAAFLNQLWVSRTKNDNTYRQKLNLAESMALSYFQELLASSSKAQKQELQANLLEFSVTLEEILTE